MQEIVIVTGSGHGLLKKISEKYDIVLIPFGISIDGKYYKSDVDITTDKLIKIINEKKVNPKTSSLSVGDLVNIYASLKEKNKSIVSIFMSGKLSTSTLDASKIAKKGCK